jgi:hypothetical protein
MNKFLNRVSIFIVIFAYILLVIAILFFPAASRPLAWTMLALSITLILIAVVGGHARLGTCVIRALKAV